MAVPSWVRELASRDTLAPVGWLQVMEITLRDRDVVVVVLELGFPVIVEQPVKHFLIIRPVTLVSIVADRFE
jgi:hypothetical protein